MTSLRLRGITKSFGNTPVLRGIDLDVEEAGFTAILGPSGCGKTTLLRLIAGFANPDSGSIRFGDKPVFDGGRSTPAQERRVGYVPQEGALFPHLDVAANISFGITRKEKRQSARIDELLNLVGLDSSVRRRYPHQLSGGQQQRVALARALAPRPSVVLLDEPFASLDAGLREGTGRAVAHALRAASATAVLVTHDQDEALSLADQVAVMRAGHLVQVGTPQDVYEGPVDTGVAEFVGAAVILTASVSGEVATTALGAIGVEPGSTQGDVTVMVRPEQLELVDVGTAGSTSATISEVSYFGHDAFVRLSVADNDRLVVARVMGTEPPPPSSQVGVRVRGLGAVFGREAPAGTIE